MAIVYPNPVDIQDKPLSGTPVSYVTALIPNVEVTKNFNQTTSNPIEILAPTPLTVTEVLNSYAILYPEVITVGPVGLNEEITFSVVLYVVVALSDTSIELLQTSVPVSAVLGLSTDVTPIQGTVTRPTVAATNVQITNGGASVTGQIIVGNISCDVYETKPVQIVVNP